MVPFSYLLLDLVNKFLAIISAQNKKINTFGTKRMPYSENS